jgi:CheY-like chemotaxis protein
MYTILVVDDSPFIVDIFVTILEQGGYCTVAAHSGEECLEIIKTLTPDLILLDIMMEPIDGWMTLEKIKKESSTKEIPILMLTAKPLMPYEAEKYNIYIEDYVLKPVTNYELYAAIENVLGRRKIIQNDMDIARQSGVEPDTINEYALLSTSINVNKRLVKLLETTYNLNDSKVDLTTNFSKVIKNMKATIKYQEDRLQQIKEKINKT